MRSTFSILAVAMIALTSASVLHAQERRMYGNYQKGAYNAQGEQVVYFLVEFKGQFDAKNAQRAADWAIQRVKKDGTTWVAGRVDLRTATDKHLVMGWHNLKRNESGWIAGSTQGNRDRCTYFDSLDTQARSASGWVHKEHRTNGWRIGMWIADDDNYNMAMSIALPK